MPSSHIAALTPKYLGDVQNLHAPLLMHLEEKDEFISKAAQAQILIGLPAKNAILIVEFAKEQYEQGKPLADAALEGARLRLRPILMTSFAFIRLQWTETLAPQLPAG